MDNLSSRLFDLYNSLGDYKAESHPSAGIAPIYNALIDAAKQALSDDPVVQAMVHTGQRGSMCRDSAGALRANIWQILSAMGETKPTIG